jgi:Xaa-Pro aminopeptidase
MEFSGMFQTFARKHGHGAKLRVRNFQAERYFLNRKNNGPIRLLDSHTSEEGISAVFPSGVGNKLLAPGEPIMIDFGSVLNGYHMVETRMFAIKSMPQRAMVVCRAAIEMHQAILELVKPGISLDELFRHCVETAKSFGSAEPNLDFPGYETSFVGHGIGLELIEPPIISMDKKDCIEPGTTFALESKMVFNNEFSAAIKSVFLATEQGVRFISKVPLEIFIC